MSQALKTDAALLSEQELIAIKQALTNLAEVKQGDDTAAIKAAIEHTNTLTDDFAARRMDQSIRNALTGHNVDEV